MKNGAHFPMSLLCCTSKVFLKNEKNIVFAKIDFFCDTK